MKIHFKILKDIRKNMGYTLKSVAKSLNLSIGYISRLENGSSEPSLQVLLALTDLYKISLDDVLVEDTSHLSASVDTYKELRPMIYNTDDKNIILHNQLEILLSSKKSKLLITNY